MITCPTCASRLADATEICPSCGQYPRGICAYCGTERLLSVPTCPACGKPWLVAQAPVVEPPPEPTRVPDKPPRKGSHRRT